MSLQTGGFFPMQSAGSIPNSYKLEHAGSYINGKSVCDLGAGVTGFITRAILNGYNFGNSYEIDPIYKTKPSFEAAKILSLQKNGRAFQEFNTSLGSLDKILSEIQKLPQQSLDYDLELEQSRQLASRKVEDVKEAIRSVLEQKDDLTRNQFMNLGIKRFTLLDSIKHRPVDIFTLGSIFYASRNPVILLSTLESLLTSNGKIVIFDHSDKPNIGDVLKMTGREGIQLLDRTGKNLCAISVSKAAIPLLKKAFI